MLEMENKSLIFDFDGVIGNTFEASVQFIAKYLKISPERARIILIKDGLKNRKDSSIYRFVKNWYYKRLLSFFEKQTDLLFKDKIEDIERLWPHNPKAILSRSDSRICRALLADKQDMFEFVLGRDKVKTKLEGLEIINLSSRFKLENCIFFTDSVGDYREMTKILKPEQIYVVTWGFQPKDFLEKYISDKRLLDNFADITEKVDKLA